MDNERIILGSGYVHVQLFDGELPTVDEICVDNTLIAYIQGGATLEYKPTKYTAKDDMGKVSKTILTEEEVTLKSGLMTFCGTTITYLCDTAEVSMTEATQDKKARRIVKVGGIGRQGRKQYVICFHHEDPVDGDIWVMIVGQNEAGFTLAFAKDKETVVDAEFKASPMDSDGTLIHYEEEIVEDEDEEETENTENTTP